MEVKKQPFAVRVTLMSNAKFADAEESTTTEERKVRNLKRKTTRNYVAETPEQAARMAAMEVLGCTEKSLEMECVYTPVPEIGDSKYGFGYKAWTAETVAEKFYQISVML